MIKMLVIEEEILRTVKTDARDQVFHSWIDTKRKQVEQVAYNASPLEISPTQNGSVFILMFKFASQPVMTIPLHWHKVGLPVGEQFAASLLASQDCSRWLSLRSHKVRETLANNL